MITTVKEHDFRVLAGVLSNLPGSAKVLIILHSGLTEIEKLAVSMSLQIAYAKLPEVQKLFPFRIELEREAVRA